MPTRRTVRTAAYGATLLAAAAVLQGATASADPGGDHRDDDLTLTFHVVTSPFSYTDLGAPGPSAADVIVFNDVLEQDGRHVGHEVGSCVVVDPSGLSNCTAVVTLDGQGTIAYAFENAPPPEKTVAITGGSGDFRTVRGDGTFLESGEGTGTLTLRLHLR
ncbi:hypothetical protein SAMN05660359_02341 [Geodermatophilus obscurus]|jgi:hypothetical protein|uniref:Dirigent-like protein n=1 Tax=Geodermatophilus obscurus TaxID=1861 RepID=A0A1I5FR77_9ACTN|nr:hypothetical protein SAMN05660359_02341 [Geodermatophilus obscurus]